MNKEQYLFIHRPVAMRKDGYYTVFSAFQRFYSVNSQGLEPWTR